MADELTDLTIAQAAEALREKRLSPVELAEAYLARIEALNPRLNAYVTVTAERARADARCAADEIARGEYRGPLHGVPIGLKDIYDTAGIRTAHGSKWHATRIPDRDSTVTRKLGEAGAVLLGKQNTHEYAWGVTTNNPHWGATHNPWDFDRIPGGSSGGSAAAIAAHLAAGTMGTDTGGSIRVPAALCGCVGLKPTYGRVSKAGVFPMSYLLDHTGPITRSVEDAAIMLQAVAGYDHEDATTIRIPVPDYLATLRDGIRGARIGVPKERFFSKGDPEVLAAASEALFDFHRLGARIVEIEFPETPWEVMSIAIAEGRAIHAEVLAKDPAALGADLQLALSAPPIDEVLFARYLHQVFRFEETVRGLFQEVDLIVGPTTPLPAPRIGEDYVAVGDVELPTLFALTAYTTVFNLSRLPAISVPCGFTSTGLPIGLQIAGRPFDEDLVLRAAHAYETSTAWHLRRPAL